MIRAIPDDRDAALYEPDDPNPDRRFKMLFEAARYHNRFSTAYSPDGLHWKEGPNNPRGPWFEPSGLTRWRGAYYVSGQGRGQWAAEGEYVRTLVTHRSDDFENWSAAGALGFRRDPIPPRPIALVGQGQDDGEQVHLGASLWNRGNRRRAVGGPKTLCGLCQAGGTMTHFLDAGA